MAGNKRSFEPINQEYDQILTKGTQSELSVTPVQDGKLRFVTDTGKLFLDSNNGAGDEKRIKISDIEDSLTEEEIFALLAPLPKVYVSKDTHRAFVKAGAGMVDIATINLEANTDDKDQPMWFSESDAGNPSYDADLKYNPNTKILTSKKMRVNGMLVTDTLNADNTTHTVEFSFE